MATNKPTTPQPPLKPALEQEKLWKSTNDAAHGGRFLNENIIAQSRPTPPRPDPGKK